jgi:hypothetical protein
MNENGTLPPARDHQADSIYGGVDQGFKTAGGPRHPSIRAPPPATFAARQG